MKNNLSRRDFVRSAAIGGAWLGLSGNVSPLNSNNQAPSGKRVGIIGLDTSHVTAFTNTLNNPSAEPEFGGYKVVAAFPTKGSADMSFSINRLAGFTEAVKKKGVEIVDSIEELLKKVDVV